MKRFTNLLLTLLSLPALAQINTKGAVVSKSLQKQGNTFALVIGISEYTALPKLQYADKDAIQFYQFLRQSLPVADTSRLSLFINQQANRDLITETLYTITEQVTAGDRVLVYFSGHGDVEQLTQTDNSLLLLSESPAKNYLRRSSSYLDIQLFRQFFQAWNEKKANVIFICDACHSGSLIGGEEGRKSTLLTLRQSWNREIKLLSCQPDEVSLEGRQWGGGRGLFSYYLILGLKGMADADKNTEVSLFELDNYLKSEVSRSSGQSQIPIAQGDLRAVVTAFTPAMLASAHKELKSPEAHEEELVALKGNDGDIGVLLKDSLSRQLYYNCRQALQSGHLLEPQEQSAYYYYQQLEKLPVNELVKNNLRLELFSALQQPFEAYLQVVYNDQADRFGILEKVAMEAALRASLSLAGKNKTLMQRVKAKLLFSEACELAVSIRPGSKDYFTLEKLRKGIGLLNQALALDSLSPQLYLRLGDYYLYSNQSREAIRAYETYQQLLPNDEYAANKLGLAYMDAGNREKAIQAFRKALQLNPGFETAARNLETALQ